MPRSRGGPGRKSKGARHIFTTRIPQALADQVRYDAEVQDLSYSDFLANIVAEKYGQALVAMPKADDQMRLTA